MYEQLQAEALKEKLEIFEVDLPLSIKGLYSDGVIWINRYLTTVEKTCALSEETGHYHTAVGDFLDQSKIENRKKERLGRAWAYERLIPLGRIIEAGQAGIEGRYAAAEYLEVTEDFLQEAIIHYQRKHGLHTVHQGYLIYFEPLQIIKL